MERRVRLTRRHLLNTVFSFERRVITDDSLRTVFLSIAIIKHFFGREWLEAQLDPDGDASAPFLRLDLDDPVKRETQSFRLVDLAELLFNLQSVEGFDLCIEHMARGNVEAAYAELDFGRMLFLGGVEFRYVKPKSEKGEDYDVEIKLPDGVTVCADAKCKIESTSFSESSVLNTLNSARKQFPSDRPSAIFVKTPAQWADGEPDLSTKLFGIADKFLRGTGRIVSVKYYTSILSYFAGEITHVQAFKEISNPQNRFDPKRNWDMFDRREDTVGSPHWEKIYKFPFEDSAYG